MIVFNANEIFQIAEQIERNGVKFYRKAADMAPNPECSKLFEGLAEMEDDHEKTFAAMRADLADKDKTEITFDPDSEEGLYLQAAAEGKVFDVNADPSRDISDRQTPQQVLQKALGLEKDSIVFYLGVKPMVPENLGKDKIDDIIQQEMGHITVLSNKLAEL